jgi:CBS domain-containing protein
MDRSVTVQEVMRPAPATVSWLESADAALARMRELGWDRLPVIDAHGVIGLCERRMLQASERRGNWMGGISVGDLMRRGPFWCRQLDSSDHVLRTMDQLNTDVLAVIDNRGRVVGSVHREQLLAAAPTN